ncbi:MAG TPA: formyltransferase family protein [Verrucomicrobiae bacterium]|nr:formyltransferase family protein [Verrucomicrobiae bacterium]
MKPRLAILASGEGTTAEAFIRAGQRGDTACVVELVICNRKQAGIFDRIKRLNQEFGLKIKVQLINSVTHPPAAGETVRPGRQTEAEEAAILDILKGGNFDLIAQMGYMKLTGPLIVREFGWRTEYASVYQARLVNTHPGLLPETMGLYGDQIQRYVLDNDLPYGGQSLHVVADGYDDGPVIAEHKVPVETGDTPASLFERVQAVEKQFLPHDIETFIMARREYLKESES